MSTTVFDIIPPHDRGPAATMAKWVTRGARPAAEAHVLMRLPRHTKTELDALAGLTGLPISVVVEEAVAAYVDRLPAVERRLLARVKARRRESRRQP
jgi:predicted DNA-binding protein